MAKMIFCLVNTSHLSIFRFCILHQKTISNQLSKWTLCFTLRYREFNHC